MKRIVFISFLLLSGCASPAKDYVEAEAAAWAEFDPYLDSWIDAHEFSKDKAANSRKRDALHQLNVARRARIKHAQESLSK